MTRDGDRGIADDASAYEDLSDEKAEKKSPRGGSGIASDSSLFEDILEENTDSIRNLESNWLYEMEGQVFGPVKPRELLEMLYHGELTPDSRVACDDDEFLPMRRYGVFRVHLPKVEKHQRDLKESKERERRATRARAIKRLVLFISAILILAIGGGSLAWWLRDKAQREATAKKEQELKAELDKLLASVTIEPPLLPLVEDEPDPPVQPTPSKSGTKKRPKKKKRRRRRMKVSGSAKGGTGDLKTSEIMAGVGKAFGGFKQCIVRQMQRDKDSIPEQIVLVFSINNEGIPKNIDLQNRHLRRTPMKNCMRNHLSKVRWRKFKGEVKNIEYPISIGGR